MVFKPVSTNALDIKKEKDKPYVGTYLGKENITTKIGPQVIWQFRDEGGQPFGVYGFSNLNRQMGHVGEGALVRLTYKGTQNLMTKFGMKDVHQVLVEVDEDATKSIGEKSEDVPF